MELYEPCYEKIYNPKGVDGVAECYESEDFRMGPDMEEFLQK